jgi:hypothetical protein
LDPDTVIDGARTLSTRACQNGAAMSTFSTNHDTPTRVESTVSAEHGARSPAARSRQRFAMLVSGTSYPLLALALWIGAGRGLWPVSAIVAALAVVMSFVGWDMFGQAAREGEQLDELSGNSNRSSHLRSFVSLSVKLGAIAMIVRSYAVVGARYGFPMPETLLGWVVPVSVLMFAAFAILRSES